MKRFRLGEIVSHLAHGGTPPTENPSLWTGKIPWITGADILNQKVGNIRRHISERAVRTTATNVVSEGDLLLVTRTGVGKMAIAPFDIAISQDFTGLTFDDRVADTNYMYFLLQAKTDDLLAFNQGTSINGITRSDLLNLEVDLPQREQQIAIADVLSTVDRAIEQTEALIAKLRRIKAGLMHDLLTRGIDEEGNLRHPSTHEFKESAVGLVPVEWEVASLGEKCRRITDGVHMSFPKGNGDIPFLFVSSIKDGKILWDDASTITEPVYEIISQGREPVQGLVLYTIVGSYGNAAVVTDDRRFSFQRHIGYLLPYSDELRPEFLSVWLNSSPAKRIADAVAFGNAQKTITLTQLKQFPVLLPPPFEQDRIVNVLQNCDMVIDQLLQQLSKLHRLKTGLMQDLLTGRVSVEPLLTNRQRNQKP